MSIFNELKRRNVFKVAFAYTIISWLLLQVSDTLAPALLLPDWIHSAVAFILILGFPIALVFAWALELSPDGLKLESPQDSGQTSKPARAAGKLNIMTMVLVFVALAYFSYSRFVLDAPRQDEVNVTDNRTLIDDKPSPEPQDTEFNQSIVVLPFVNMSSDDEQEYFSDGISEELLNLLTKIPDLRVISRTSAFYYKGKNATIEEISNELNVAYVLEGSVRKSENQLRITAQLIDARTDTHIWSETYDRELKNIFAIQDDISAAIVDALKDSLELQVETTPRVAALINTEAHDAFLRGRHLLLQRTKSSIEDAVKKFEKAIEANPGYALAHAELAIANLLLSRTPGAYGDLTESEALARAVPHAEQALKLDPSLAEAQAATGFVLKRQGQLEQALVHFQRAIEINPSYSEAYTWMGRLLDRDLGNYVQGSAVREQALRYDPLSRPAISNYMSVLFASDRFDEASRELEKIATIYPDIYAIWKGIISSQKGLLAARALGLLSAMKITNGLTKTPLTWLSYTFAHAGLEDEALALFNPPLSLTLTILGRHEGAVTVANERVFEDPTSLHDLRLQAQALASGGYYTRARPVLENLWHQSNKTITLGGAFGFENAVALIVIRQAAGENTEELVMAIDDHVRRLKEVDNNRRANYEAGIAAFLTGERERGLALIAEEVEYGKYLRLNHAYLQTLYDDDGFSPIRRMQETRASIEREKILNVVCIDNPYAAVWQPSESTCDRFAKQKSG